MQRAQIETVEIRVRADEREYLLSATRAPGGTTQWQMQDVTAGMAPVRAAVVGAVVGTLQQLAECVLEAALAEAGRSEDGFLKLIGAYRDHKAVHSGK